MASLPPRACRAFTMLVSGAGVLIPLQYRAVQGCQGCDQSQASRQCEHRAAQARGSATVLTISCYRGDFVR